MKQLTPIQISILLRLMAKDERVMWADHKDITELHNQRLITGHITGVGAILSKSGQKIVDNILSLVNEPTSSIKDIN